ncbi:MAG: hypothetical protein FWH50_03005, partial [Coriobacteriia bacterium]|nr:hypothetical protein [Coriobacteriia bacterium]
DWKDSWFVGYTPQLVTAVWVGLRSEPTYMYNNEGGVMCAPTWHYFMSELLSWYPVEEFTYYPPPRYRENADFMTEQEREVYLQKKTDTDGDGFSDWDEIQAGTDPKNPNDYPGKTADPPPGSSGIFGGGTGDGGDGGGTIHIPNRTNPP